MTVKELRGHLDKLPDDAHILTASIENDYKFDDAVTVERLLVSELRGTGGKVIAGVIRFKCKHP